MQIKGNRKRVSAPKNIAYHVNKLIKPIFGNRGFTDATIVNNWQEIAGEYLASHCLPEKIQYPRGQKNKGTLHLRINNGGLALELQNIESVLIDSINAYFGYGAIERIKMTQGPLIETPKRKTTSPRLLSKKEERILFNGLSDVSDVDLHQVLERLGRAISRKSY